MYSKYEGGKIQVVVLRLSQYARRNSYKIEKTVKKTSQSVPEVHNVSYFNFQIEGYRIHQLGSLTEPTEFGLNWLTCLAEGFYGLQSRGKNKIYHEPLMHALSPWEGLVEVFPILLRVQGTMWISFFQELSPKTFQIFGE